MTYYNHLMIKVSNYLIIFKQLLTCKEDIQSNVDVMLTKHLRYFHSQIKVDLIKLLQLSSAIKALTAKTCRPTVTVDEEAQCLVELRVSNCHLEISNVLSHNRDEISHLDYSHLRTSQ